MKTLIENLYGKLEDWGIDPISLTKAIGIFLIIVLLIGLIVLFPILLKILVTTVVCVILIGLIYLMLE